MCFFGISMKPKNSISLKIWTLIDGSSAGTGDEFCDIYFYIWEVERKLFHKFLHQFLSFPCLHMKNGIPICAILEFLWNRKIQSTSKFGLWLWHYKIMTGKSELSKCLTGTKLKIDWDNYFVLNFTGTEFLGKFFQRDGEIWANMSPGQPPRHMTPILGDGVSL